MSRPGRAGRVRSASARVAGAADGYSIAELLIALAVVGVTAAIGVPSMAEMADAGRGWTAAQSLATEFRETRLLAVARGVTTGLVFDHTAGGWLVRRCADVNGDGLSRADIGAGLDVCEVAEPEFERRWRGVGIAIDPSIPGPDSTPPSADPVRFGSADIASFTPDGTATGGTVFMRSAAQRHFAVRVAGVTGRIRLLRYDALSSRWTE